jgi:hypothetical protein
MMNTVTKWASVAGLVGLGLTLGIGGIYVAQTEDAPGAALFGFLLMLLALWGAVKIARKGEQR